MSTSDETEDSATKLAELLRQYKENKHTLELQIAAAGGPMQAPLILINNLTSTTDKITSIQREIESIKPQLPPNDTGRATHPANPGLDGALSTAQRRRLEQKASALRDEYALRSEKINRIRKALAIEASALVQFQLEQQLKEETAAFERVEEELDGVERQLG
jgi:hypothetical protein